MEFEARPYGPDSSPEEVAAIRDRVSLYADDIVLYRELPIMSLFTVDVMFDRVAELVRAHDCSYLIVDVSAGGRPDAAARSKILKRVKALKSQLRHIAVITLRNPLVTVAAKFVRATLPASLSLSLYDSVPEAEEAIRRDYASLGDRHR